MSESPKPSTSSFPRFALPLIVFLVALVIRLIGIDWGLPNENHRQSYHPDEPVVWAYSQAIQPAKLSFTPGFYNYGTLYLTTLKIASDVVAGYSGGGVNPEKPDDVWSFIGKAHLAGRVISAIAGALTVLFVALILRRFTNEFGVAFGSLAVAFAPAHVVHSRFQTVDILAAFLVVMSAYFAVRLLDQDLVPNAKQDLKFALLSGLFAGLSAGTKYTGILCLVTLFVIALGAKRQAGWKLAMAGLGAAIAAFVITTPGFLLENAEFMKGFLYETQHVKEGHGLVFEGSSPGFIYHIANLFLGMGMIVSVMGVAGLVVASVKRHWWAIGLLAFFVIYYFVIAGAEVKFIRYTFPLYLGIAVGFGWAIGKVRDRGGRWHAAVALGILGLGGFFGGGLQSAVRFTSFMTSPDPRDAAGEYLRGGPGTVGVVADPWFYSPAIHPDLGRRLVYAPGRPFVGISTYEGMHRILEAMSNPSIVRYMPANGLAGRLDWDSRLLTEAKPDYVVYSSFESEGLDRIAQLRNPSPVGKATSDRAREFMEKLRQNYDFDRQFGTAQSYVHDMMYVQPTIWVWKRKPDR